MASPVPDVMAAARPDLGFVVAGPWP